MEHCGETESRFNRKSTIAYSPTLLPQSYCQVIVEERPLSSWNQRLARLSNLASIICVIDCTVLPLLTVLLSVLGFAEQPNQWQWLHELGHGVAIFFVLPGTYYTSCLNLSSRNVVLTNSYPTTPFEYSRSFHCCAKLFTAQTSLVGANGVSGVAVNLSRELLS
jgi:MerC mercury resistance protein